MSQRLSSERERERQTGGETAGGRKTAGTRTEVERKTRGSLIRHVFISA